MPRRASWEVRPLRVTGRHGDDAPDRLQLRGDLLDEAVEVRSDEEHFGLRVVDDVGDFRRCEAPVDADGHGVGTRTAEDDLVEEVRVLVEKGHAPGGTDPFGDETVGDLVRAPVEGCVTRPASFELEGDLLRAHARLEVRQVGQGLDLFDGIDARGRHARGSGNRQKRAILRTGRDVSKTVKPDRSFGAA